MQVAQAAHVVIYQLFKGQRLAVILLMPASKGGSMCSRAVDNRIWFAIFYSVCLALDKHGCSLAAYQEHSGRYTRASPTPSVWEACGCKKGGNFCQFRWSSSRTCELGSMLSYFFEDAWHKTHGGVWWQDVGTLLLSSDTIKFGGKFLEASECWVQSQPTWWSKQTKIRDRSMRKPWWRWVCSIPTGSSEASYWGCGKRNDQRYLSSCPGWRKWKCYQSQSKKSGWFHRNN